MPDLQFQAEKIQILLYVENYTKVFLTPGNLYLHFKEILFSPKPKCRPKMSNYAMMHINLKNASFLFLTKTQIHYYITQQ